MIKKRITGVIAATVLGIMSILGPNYVSSEQQKYLSSTVTVEKVEKHLKEQPLGLGAILLGDLENVDEIRSCLILDLASFDEKTEAIMAGVSQKGDFFYMLSGKSEIELTDYKSNGYGSVDEIFIRYDDNTIKKITNPTKEQAETANDIYELILNQYYKQIIIQEKDEESLKTSGEKLERLIEELKNYK